MSRLRTSKSPASANLYCASCETVIGTFKNEWQHVTGSYALPTLPGEHHEPIIEERTRIVPNGKSSRAAEGCEMANVLCSSCSATIGQHCVNVRRRDQRHLLNAILYKLTRVWLMEHGTIKKKGFYFTDENPEVEESPTDSQTNETFNAMQTFTNPRLAISPAIFGLSRMKAEGSQTPPVPPQKVQPPIENLMMLTRQMCEHGNAINDNFNRVAIANKSVESIRLEMKVNYTRYLQHEKAIQELLSTVEDQKKHIQRLSAELYNIRTQLNQKETKEQTPKQLPLTRRGPLSGLSPPSTNRVVQDMRMHKDQDSDREESLILGKRKRTDREHVRTRKSSRNTSSRTQNHDSGSLATPESTQDSLETPSSATIDKERKDSEKETTSRPRSDENGRKSIFDSSTDEGGAKARTKDSNSKVVPHTVASPVEQTTHVDVADAIDFSTDDDYTSAAQSAESRQNEKTSPQARPNCCLLCYRSGRLLCCENCSDRYHFSCLEAPVRPEIFMGTGWLCPTCAVTKADDIDMVIVEEDKLDNSTLDGRLRLAQENMLRSEANVAVKAVL